ncbi:MAG: hypothetical protein FWG45_04210 [Oscillospiraceae bacterium]|nr:hypothetical protein [Oscillospiraceae bacterium]
MKTMKKAVMMTLATAMILTLTACLAFGTPEITNETSNNAVYTTDNNLQETDIADATETTAPTDDTNTSDTNEGAVITSPSSVNVDDAPDAKSYNEKDKAIPLGHWVYYQEKNYDSGEYEPFYVRLISVSRDQDEIQAAIDDYSGIMDFTLTEDQARDIEYGLLEYEVYYSPDYQASQYGIMFHGVNWRATPIETTSFKTAGGMTYISVGSTYNLNTNGTNRAKPGETVREKALFSVLKNYSESEYVFEKTWYDGEIVTEKSHKLYMAVV